MGDFMVCSLPAAAFFALLVVGLICEVSDDAIASWVVMPSGLDLILRSGVGVYYRAAHRRTTTNSWFETAQNAPSHHEEQLAFHDTEYSSAFYLLRFRAVGRMLFATAEKTKGARTDVRRAIDLGQRPCGKCRNL
jgi:hypothetical protein